MTFTIGSDPELSFAEKQDKSPIFINVQTLPSYAEFGYDGRSGEIRARESTDPLQHVDNIEKALFGRSSAFPTLFTYSMYGYSKEFPVGGHIHFGIRALLENETYRNRTLTMLDSLLAFPYMFLEDPDIARIRKNSYGDLSDFREQPHGLEYRTLSSWLAGKRLAQGVITLAYTIVDAVSSGMYFKGKLISEERGFNEIFDDHNIKWVYPYLSGTATQIRSLPLYPRYREYIEYLLYHARKNDYVTTGEIKKGWKIPYITVKTDMMYTTLELTRLFSQTVSDTLPTPEDRAGYIYFVSSDYLEHFDIPHICRRVNLALNRISRGHVSQTFRVSTVRIKGQSSTDERIYIYFDGRYIRREKMQRLCRLLTDVLKGYGAPYTISLLESDLHKKIAHGGYSDVFLTLPKSLRLRKDYMAEIVIFLAILYANNGVYKTYRRVKKTGENVDLGVVVESLVKTLSPLVKKKRTPKPIINIDSEDGGVGFGGLDYGTLEHLNSHPVLVSTSHGQEQLRSYYSPNSEGWDT